MGKPFLSTLLVIFALTAVLPASGQRLPRHRDPLMYTPTDNLFRVGFRVFDGPSVTFGDLGELAFPDIGEPTGIRARSYSDGTVRLDTRVDEEGQPLPEDGFTDSWNYSFASQLTSDGNMAFSVYEATTLGGTTDAESKSGSGWELVYERKIGKIGEKSTWGLLAGFGFADINAQTRGTIRSRLSRMTDIYSLNGVTPPDPPYNAPSFEVIPGEPDEDGNIMDEVVETTVLLGNQPLSRTVTEDEADVLGFWQIKGAYFTFRLGPTVRFSLTERFAISASAGAAASYFGTEFRIQETLDLENVVQAPQTREESRKNAWLPSFYAEANAEIWVTPRTGFFLGALYQGGGDYNQTLGGRTVKLNQGSAVGIQAGVVFHF